jgi:hypothetical protein
MNIFAWPLGLAPGSGRRSNGRLRGKRSRRHPRTNHAWPARVALKVADVTSAFGFRYLRAPRRSRLPSHIAISARLPADRDLVARAVVEGPACHSSGLPPPLFNMCSSLNSERSGSRSTGSSAAWRAQVPWPLVREDVRPAPRLWLRVPTKAAPWLAECNSWRSASPLPFATWGQHHLRTIVPGNSIEARHCGQYATHDDVSDLPRFRPYRGQVRYAAVECSRCERRRRYNVARLIERYVPEPRP